MAEESGMSLHFITKSSNKNQGAGKASSNAAATGANRCASRIYFHSVLFLGFGALSIAICSGELPLARYEWMVLASLTALAGRFPIKLPGGKSKISIADTFIFANTILFGPAAGSVTAALEGFLGSVRSSIGSRRPAYISFNVALMGLSTYLAGKIFFLLTGSSPYSSRAEIKLQEIMLPVLVMACIHYLANTLAVAGMVALEAHKSFFRLWRERFLWTSFNYFAGGSAAALLVVSLPSLSAATMGLVLPILLIAYFAYKTHLEKAEENSHRRQLDRMYLRTVEALAAAIDARESGTLGVARRTQHFAKGLAKAMKIEDENICRGIEAAALLLDIGNLAVPEYILNHPGELSGSEFQKVKTHPVVGADILSTIDFPYPVVDYVRHHHERWDGTGYPDMLKGNQIPLGARILSVADSFAALTCDRPYQRAHSKDKAMHEIRLRVGTFYDPEIVASFELVVDDLIQEFQAAQAAASRETPQASTSLLPAGQRVESQDARGFGVFREISSTQREVTALMELTQALSATLSLKDSLEVLVGVIAKVLPFATCAVYLYSEIEECLKAEYVKGGNRAIPENHILEISKSLSGRALLQRTGFISTEAWRDLAGLEEPCVKGLVHALVCPMIHNEKWVGAISLYAAEADAFNQDDMRVISAFAQKAAAAIQNAVKYASAREQAMTDSLTTLPNMRFLRQVFEVELANAERHGAPLSLLVMDLDGFKAVNDRYGHQMGDRLLKEVAQSLKNMMRGGDLVVRQGGDEFVAVLIGTTHDDAYRLAGRIQMTIDELRPDPAHGDAMKFGISIGCACFPEDGRSLEVLLKKADLVMYQDKKARRSGTSRFAMTANMA
jgi:diguanylate cyclase (GGDEF)-like protein